MSVFERALVFACFLAFINCANACLPKLDIPKQFLSCKENSDCEIYKDACRTCGDLIVVHKKFLNDLKKIDYDLRIKASCNPKCEACSVFEKKVECKKTSDPIVGVCVIKMG